VAAVSAAAQNPRPSALDQIDLRRRDAYPLIAHTQFSAWQEHCVKQTLWSDEQFERRVNRKLYLPATHPREDLMKIARAKYPNGDTPSWKLLAAYALGTEKKQASGITEALESARYRAKQAGRDEAIFKDIEAALIHDHGFINSRPDNAARLQEPCINDANGAKQRSQIRKIDPNVVFVRAIAGD
jgi:hypothetical protein